MLVVQYGEPIVWDFLVLFPNKYLPVEYDLGMKALAAISVRHLNTIEDSPAPPKYPK